MADSNLTKKDVLNFLNLGRKIAFSGAGAVLNVVRSKIAELTDSEEVFQRRVAVQVQSLVENGFTEAEARKAIDDRMKGRLDKAFEKCAKPTINSAMEK